MLMRRFCSDQSLPKEENVKQLRLFHRSLRFISLLPGAGGWGGGGGGGIESRTLLRSRASEPCSLVIKVRALNAHAPTLTFPRCSDAVQQAEHRNRVCL